MSQTLAILWMMAALIGLGLFTFFAGRALRKSMAGVKKGLKSRAKVNLRAKFSKGNEVNITDKL